MGRLNLRVHVPPPVFFTAARPTAPLFHQPGHSRTTTPWGAESPEARGVGAEVERASFNCQLQSWPSCVQAAYGWRPGMRHGVPEAAVEAKDARWCRASSPFSTIATLLAGCP